MKTYAVGGSVRDELLGLPVQDRDYVVVGATPEEMLGLGFRPVGADFPVFLHPETREQYALARTERKTAPGYRGFAFHAAPDVTLEEDLRRRDLTINAMARAADGALVDPHGGEADLRAGILRHVSEAFAEDPVRILRVARFAARFGFAVAPGTLALMRRMVRAGEADALVPERVWQEVARGLLEPKPSRMLEVLAECGALERVMPEIARGALAAGAMGSLARRLDEAAAKGLGLAARFASLALDAGPEGAAALGARLNAPSECRELAVLAARERERLHAPGPPEAEALLAMLERCDAFRRPERLERLLEVAECDGAPGARHWLVPARDAARSVDAGAIARDSPGDVPGAVRRARLAALARARGA